MNVQAKEMSINISVLNANQDINLKMKQILMVIVIEYVTIFITLMNLISINVLFKINAHSKKVN
jgi:hypothetical protein